MIFSDSVNLVHRVRVFSRLLDDGRQVLAVEFSYRSDDEAEFFLPLWGNDLERDHLFYPVFFAHVNRIFPKMPVDAPELHPPVEQLTEPLQGYCVGSTLSCVLPAGWWRIVPLFVVFRPGNIFKIPAEVMIGDSSPSVSLRDHWLYVQDWRPDSDGHWGRSEFPAGCSIRCDYANGSVSPMSHFIRHRITGRGANSDVVVRGSYDPDWFRGNDWKSSSGIEPTVFEGKQNG